jgi:hypothetical protein
MPVLRTCRLIEAEPRADVFGEAEREKRSISKAAGLTEDGWAQGGGGREEQRENASRASEFLFSRIADHGVWGDACKRARTGSTRSRLRSPWFANRQKRIRMEAATEPAEEPMR